MLKKACLITIIISLFSSCTKDSVESNTPEYVGFYKIVSFQVPQAVDLNNDKISNTDLTLEFDQYFDDSAQDLEILLRGEDPKHALKIKFPDWNLDSGTSEPQSSSHQFYSLTLIAYYTIENEFQFIPKNWGDNEELIEGQLDQNNYTISLILKKKYFNFDTNEWEKMEISATYEKVDP